LQFCPKKRITDLSGARHIAFLNTFKEAVQIIGNRRAMYPTRAIEVTTLRVDYYTES